MSVARRTRIVLAFSGLAIALATVLPPRRPFVRDVVATVNDVPIPAAALIHALARAGATAEARRESIEHLVDEELLVQRAIEVGLVDSDRGIRKALARATIDRALREGAARAPSEAELRAFHAAHAALFGVPRSVRVRAISFHAGQNTDDVLHRAQQVAAAIAEGLSFDDARARFGDSPALPIANALLPEPVLRREIGPALADAALALAPGSVSAPLRVGSSAYLLQVTADAPARTLDFDLARNRVEAEWTRRRGDESLAHFLSTLRSAARIVRAADAPSP
jgi:hypothetical protein